jgi:hypothetical protein
MSGVIAWLRVIQWRLPGSGSKVAPNVAAVTAFNAALPFHRFALSG